jgi:2-hydroxychromene-2-carboxylate isomerase
MPITIGVDREHPFVTTTVWGHVTYEEIQSHLSEEEELRATGYPELVDAMAASTTLTTDEVRALVNRTHDMLRRGAFGPTAIASDNDVVYGMARMYQILAERDGISVGVFRSVVDAERWLRAE